VRLGLTRAQLKDVVGQPAEEGLSPTGRYRCAKCNKDFCPECDL